MDRDLADLLKECNDVVLNSDLEALQKIYIKWNNLYWNYSIGDSVWLTGIQAINTASNLVSAQEK